MSTSTLFLQNVTSIDHAFIDNVGQIQGGSYNASFEVTGEVESQEQVVVDFGKVKASIKRIIDGQKFGFDHKLWIIDGYSNFLGYEHLDIDYLVKITTPIQELVLPIDATKILPNNVIPTVIADQVQDGLNAIYPGANIAVKCFLSTIPIIPIGCSEWSLFRYTHGLKNSSSWGCQNIAHGHLSYIGASHPNGKPVYFDEILEEIDNTNFIFTENLAPNNDSEWVSSYYTEERGQFIHTFDNEKVKHTIIPTETTIENLIVWVKEKYGTLLRKQGVTRFYMSEGLCKGAVIDL